MKEIYKIGYNYFSSWKKADQYRMKYYVKASPNIIQTIRLDAIDLTKDILIVSTWRFEKKTSSLDCHNFHRKTYWEDVTINQVEIFVSNQYVTIHANLECPSVKEAKKYILSSLMWSRILDIFNEYRLEYPGRYYTKI